MMGNRKNPKRTPFQIESDRMFCAEHSLKGMTYRQIAEALNERNKNEGRDYTLSHVQVYRDIQIMIGLWQCANKMLIEEFVMLSLMKLDVVEREAWAAWDKSKTDLIQEKIRGGKLDPKTGRIIGGETYWTRTTNRYGDPRYISLLTSTIKQRERLLGLSAETRRHTRYHDPVHDEPLYKYEYGDLSEERKKILLELWQKIKERQETSPDTQHDEQGQK